MRFRCVLLLALLLLPAGLATAQESPRFPVPVEEFLPADTLAFVTLPNGRAALDALFGDGIDDVAARLASRLPDRAKAAPADVEALIEKVVAAADGPITFSAHQIRLPRRQGGQTWLVTAFTADRKNVLETAGLELLRKGIAPSFSTVEGKERLMEIPTIHFAGPKANVYATYARGFLIVSPSVLTIGRVLRELQSPTGRTLKYEKGYEAARKASGLGKGDAFLYVREAGLLPGGSLVRALDARGVLRADGTDSLTVRVEGGGRLKSLGTLPGQWADPPAGGVWLSAVIAPSSTFNLAVELLGDQRAIHASWLADVADGRVELWWEPGKDPVLRLATVEGRDAARAIAPLRGVARVTKPGTILLSRDETAVADGVHRKPRAVDQEGGARLEASLPALFDLLGRKGTGGTMRVTWTIIPGDGTLTLRPVGESAGPVRVFVNSLFR